MRKVIYLTFLSFFSLLSSAGQVIIKNQEVVEVKGGWFEMGGKLDPLGYKREDSFPKHKIYVDSFYIGTHEVTNAQYCDFLNSLNLPPDKTMEKIRIESPYCYIKYKNAKYVVIKGYEDFPVNHISWEAANEYCQVMKGRLPSEAEWEYAAKGGVLSKGFIYSGSNIIDDVGVTSNNIKALCKVKSLRSNELGIFDMSGNVKEYCSDWYDPKYYEKSPIRNPKGPENPVKYLNGFPLKVMKGGCFNMAYNMAIPEYRWTASANRKKGGHWSDGFRICFDK